MEDEAVLDRGASFLKHVCDDEEVEGKNPLMVGEFLYGTKPLFLNQETKLGEELDLLWPELLMKFG